MKASIRIGLLAFAFLAPVKAGLVLFGGGLTLESEGGTAFPYNLAAGKTAFANDVIGPPHSIAAVNDGNYGNSSSWIAASGNGFVGISLGSIPTSIHKIAFGRDNLGLAPDRALGTYTLQFTTVADPDAATPDESWTTIGTLHYQSAGGANFANPHLRHVFSFTPVMATGIRLKTVTSSDFIGIDELEIYAPPAIRVEHPPGVTWSGEHSVLVAGSNSDGEGNVPADLAGVVSVTMGIRHVVALKSDRTVVSWGSNSFGQLNAPAGLTEVQAIAAGDEHTLALRSNGTITAWGGRNTFDELNVPAGLAGVRAISSYDRHSVALKSDGTVVAWGDNSWGQLNVPAGLTGVTAVAAGQTFTMTLKNDGTVAVWGADGFSAVLKSVPVGLANVTAIAAGGGHAVALKSDGTVVAWGFNDYGQTNVPVGLSDVRSIAAGVRQTIALKNDGTVVFWGEDDGQAAAFSTLTGVEAIAGGLNSSAVIQRGADAPVVAFNYPGLATTTTKTFTVTNPGGSQLNIASVHTAGGQASDFVVNTAGMSSSLAPGASTTFTVSYGPASTAPRTTTLHITSDSVEQPIFDIVLKGNLADTRAPIFLPAPQNLFANTTNPAGTQINYPPVAAVDDSGAPTHITYSIPSGSDFAIGETTVTITATDSSGNTATASFIVTVSLPALVLVETGGQMAADNLAIGKTALAKDVIGVAPHTIAKVNDGLYGNANSWIAGSANSFIGINLGSTPVTVRYVAFGRDNDGIQTTRVAGTYTLEFTTVPNPGAATPDSSWASFPPLEYPGSIPSPGRRHVYSIPSIEATGVRLKLSSNSIEIGIDELELYENLAAQITVEQPVGAPLTAGAASIHFPSQNLGTDSSEKAFTINNTGNIPLTISSLTTTGGEAGDFIVNTSGTNTAVPHTSGNTTFSVLFRPTGLGPRSTTLRIVSNDAATPDFTITLTGTGTDTLPPVIEPLDDVIAYSADAAGTVVNFDKSSSISDNSGTVLISYSPASGSHFPLGSTTVTATAADGLGQVTTATFSVIVNAAARLIVEQPIGSPLSGSPPSVFFGSVTLPGSESRTFTLKNTGLVPLNLNSINVVGGQAAEFSLNTTGTASPLAINASTTLSVTFTPANIGIRSTSLNLASNDPTTPNYAISLNGSGVDTEPPVITSAPLDFSVLASSASGVRVIFPAATATDNLALPVTLSYSHASGSLFPLGSTLVTTTATDAAGNTDTATFTITVTSTTLPPDVPTGGSVPNNLALGKTAFAKDVVGVAPHTIAKVNDGIYGNPNSWIANSLDSYVGINLGATPRPINRIAFGRDNNGLQSSRATGTYTLQFTTTPNPDATTPDGAWQTIATLLYPNDVTNPILRNLFAFATVNATGIRLKTLGDIFPIGIDELELYGPLTPQQSWRDQYFSITSNTGDAADDADPNKNGIPNLLEYALGGNPADNSTGQGILPTGSRPGSQLQLHFNRLLDRNDIDLTVQASPNLTAWTDLARSTAGQPFALIESGAGIDESGTGNTRAVIITDPATGTRRFLRLSVTPTPSP
ncbi:MAG: HYR domain-containing protein [Luteolibacter sp.]|nr:HYR domain-containing protein [Luteolibacter sp.]